MGLKLGLEVRWRGKGRCELGKLEEGLLGQGGGGECAGKSEAGCPGHRIIVVKYSWAFGPDAISEQRERASGRSLEQCCSPLAPTAATDSPDRPRDAHHVHTHTSFSSCAHTHTCTHKMELCGTCKHTSHPWAPQTGRCTPYMDVYPHPLTQDPTPSNLTSSGSQPPQTTQIDSSEYHTPE